MPNRENVLRHTGMLSLSFSSGLGSLIFWKVQRTTPTPAGCDMSEKLQFCEVSEMLSVEAMC